MLVTAAVLSGQLSIGWSNDLVDLARDRAVGRTRQAARHRRGEPARRDRRLRGRRRPVRRRSPWPAGCVAGLVHLACVAAGWAYNLGLKATVWSWAPYAAAFGALPVFVVAGR